MRVNELTGIHSMFEDISIEAHRAQRMAELEQIARYRSTRLAQLQAWSYEKQRTQIQINLKVEEAKAREKMAGKTVYLPPRLDLIDMVHIREICKPKPKRSWLARLFGRA